LVEVYIIRLIKSVKSGGLLTHILGSNLKILVDDVLPLDIEKQLC
jgi:hypothetical protein